MSSPWFHLDPGGRLLDDIGIGGPIAAAAVLALDYFLTSILAKELKRALRLSVGLAWLYLVISAARCLTPEHNEIDTIFKIISAIALSIAVAQTLFVLIVDFVLGRNGKKPLRPMIRYGLLGVTFLVAALAGMKAGGVTGNNVLISGAVVIGGVGAAVAEVLRQVGAGVLVQYARPFEIGDVIQVLPLEQRGTVVSINWRSTTVRSVHGLEYMVPNNDMVTHTVVNYGHGERGFRRDVTFEGTYDTPPESVRQAVLSSLRDVAGVDEQPPPSVVVSAFHESGVAYTVRYWTHHSETFDTIDAEVRARIWYAFARAGLEFPFPTRTLHLADRRDHAEVSRARAAKLQRTLLFSTLGEEAVLDIALHGREQPYAAGEIIVHAGEPGTTMHLILEGECAVQSPQDRRELLRLGAGDFFGEMSLITGAPRAATVVAAAPTRTFVIDEPSFRAMVSRHPEIAGALGDILSARQNDLARRQNESEGTPEQGEKIRTAMMERIKRVFGLGGDKPPPPPPPAPSSVR